MPGRPPSAPHAPARLLLTSCQRWHLLFAHPPHSSCITLGHWCCRGEGWGSSQQQSRWPCAPLDRAAELGVKGPEELQGRLKKQAGLPGCPWLLRDPTLISHLLISGSPQGEVGPPGPAGSAGARGAPVSSCSRSQRASSALRLSYSCPMQLPSPPRM